MKFIIQTIEGQIVHDFSFELLKAIKYQDWLGNTDIQYVLSDNGILYSGYIPIGSNEFVIEYLKKYYGKEPKPINVPAQLLNSKYTNRVIFNGTANDILDDGKFKFIKSNDKLKSDIGIVRCNPGLTGKSYQISEVIPDINSEWRAFVYKQKLVGLQNYSGEFDLFPDVNIIKEMIQVYTDSPVAYTLDVAIHHDNTLTSVIEVHDFFSCGLYGFNDYRILPFMYERWFNEFVNRK